MIDRSPMHHQLFRASQWRLMLWTGLCALLLLPFLLMQVTPDMNWGAEDFLAAALLVGGVGLGIELAVRRLRTPRQRVAGGAVIILAALLVWAELAVGIFD